MAARHVLKKALVTGGNKGIGFSLCRDLLDSGFHVILGSRSLERGRDAVEVLKRADPKSSVEMVHLDIIDPKSIDECAQFVKEEYKTLDVLVNNAGILFKGDSLESMWLDSDMVEFTLETNYFGTRNLTEKLLPLVTERVVNVTSRSGHLGKFPSFTTRKALRECESTEELDAVVGDFKAAVVEFGDNISKHWPHSAYSVSMAAKIMWTRVMAGQWPELFWASCCPGYVNTDMTSHRGFRTPEQGAFVISQLAKMDVSDRKETPSGRMWASFYELEMETKGISDWREAASTHIIPWKNPSWDH